MLARRSSGSARNRRLDEYFRRLGAAARTGEVDVEALLRQAVEVAVDEALRRGGGDGAPGDGELRRELEELRAEVAELRRAVEELRASLGRAGAGGGGLDAAALAKAVAEAVGRVLQRYCSGAALAAAGQRLQEARSGDGASGDEPRWLRALRERLRSRGYLFTHELPPELRDEFDPEQARARGLVVLPLGGSYLVATREAYDDFVSRLKGLRTSDEYEAEAKLGRYRLLFRVLRGEGAVYYAGPGRGWVLSLHA